MRLISIEEAISLCKEQEDGKNDGYARKWRMVRLALAKSHRENNKKAAALRAIAARVDGEPDHPDLKAYGLLGVDTDLDCYMIAKRALGMK